MKYHLSIPSKTFLLGEYIALNGGPTLVLATEKRFKLTAIEQANNKNSLEGINPQSPAGKLVARDLDFYKKYQISYKDPYKGLGGFGASTAQFIMLAALKQHVITNKVDEFSILDDYMALAWEGEGIPPSGADLVGQMFGNICYFYKKEKVLHSFSWPFSDLGYCLIHTGNKLATHLHLRELEKFDGSELEKIVAAGLTSIRQSNSQHFITCINDYANVLLQQNLVAKETQAILQDLSTFKSILAAKGCGALGADVILVLFDIKQQNEVVEKIKSYQLQVITYGQEVSNGIEIEVS